MGTVEAVESEIARVNAAIEALEPKIEKAEGKAEAAENAGNTDAVQRWFTELQQLRENKNKLLDKEKQLRDEKARLHSAAAAGPSTIGTVAETTNFLDYAGRFKELLLKSHLRDTPRVNEVVEVVARRLPAHLMVANTPTKALHLYNEAKLLPGASTQNHFLTQHNLRVNGPLFPLKGPASLLTAVNGKGRPCVVKLLQGRIEVGAQGQPGGSEAHACETLLASAEQEGVPLIRGRVLELSSTTEHRSTGHPPGRYAALLCDQYCGTVAESLQLTEEALEAGVKRMVKAVEYMHGKGLAHMDIKGDNIMIDYQGQWFLGDFGSTVPIGAQIESTTEWFLPTKVLGRLAEVRYDWYMLATMLAAELDKVTWKERLLSGSHTPPDKLAAALQAVVLPSLKDLIADILVRAEVLS